MSTIENNPQSVSREPRDSDWLAFDAYVFDIDGTLLNARDLVHYNSFQQALREVYGCERDITEVPLHGNTDIGILRATTKLAGVSDQAFEEGLQEALAKMRTSTTRNAASLRCEVLPSIREVLATLQARGKLLGVATGNLEEVGWPKLAAAQLKQYFNFGCFSDNHEQRSEIFKNALLEVRRRLGADATVCFVGDTPNDIAAARANLAPVISVATGIHSYEVLQALQPDFCLRTCDDLFLS